MPAEPLNYARAVSSGDANIKRGNHETPGLGGLLNGSSARGRRNHQSPGSPMKGNGSDKQRSRAASTVTSVTTDSVKSRGTSIGSRNVETNGSAEIRENAGDDINNGLNVKIPSDYSISTISHHRRNSSIHSIKSEMYHSNRSSLSPCHQNQVVYPYPYQSSPYFFVPQSYPGTGYNAGVAAYGPSHSGFSQRTMSGFSGSSNHPFNTVSSPQVSQTSGFPVVSSQPWQQMNQHYFYQGGYDQTAFYPPIYGISPHSFMRPMSSYPSISYSYSGQSYQTSYLSTQPAQMSKSVSSASDCPPTSTMAPPTFSETNTWSSQATTDETGPSSVVRPQKRVNAAVKIVNPKTNMEISISPTLPASEKENLSLPVVDETSKDVSDLSDICEQKDSEVLAEPENQIQDGNEPLETKEAINDNNVDEKMNVEEENNLCVSEKEQSDDHDKIEEDLTPEIEESKESIENGHEIYEDATELTQKAENIVKSEQKMYNVIEVAQEEEKMIETSQETKDTFETVQEDAIEMIQGMDILEPVQNIIQPDRENLVQDSFVYEESSLEKKDIETSTSQELDLNSTEKEHLEIINEDKSQNDHNNDKVQDCDINEFQDKLSIKNHETAAGQSGPSSTGKTKKKSLLIPLGHSEKDKNDTHVVSMSITSLKNSVFITDLKAIVYPEGFNPPKTSLNVNSLPGKFKYDQEFLLQFQKVYIDKPDFNWDERIKDTIGDGMDDKKPSKNSLGGLTSRSISRSIGVSMTSTPIGSFGLNKPLSLGKSASNQHCSHINTQTQQMSDSSSNISEESFGISKLASNKSVSGITSSESGSPVGSRFPLSCSGNSSSHGFSMSRSGSPVTSRIPSRKGGSRRGTGLTQSESKADKHDQKSGSNMLSDHVAPLALSANRWQPKLKSLPIQPGEHMDPEMVQRKVKAALNKLTVDNFDRITDQILEIASQSKNETDGRTLRQIIQLTFEKATDEANFSSMYARFCRKMMETTSSEIRDEKLQLDKNGRPITGGILFRKYLLNRCQENFERGWKANLPSKSDGEFNTQEAEMLSDEYYILVTAKRRGLGLIKFIGELFKLNMLTERIMHECIKKLLANVVDPDEEEIESLCKLLATIGKDLESTEKGHVHMNVYIERMDKIVKTSNLSNRIKFMVMDILDLRKNGWKSKNADKGPKTIAEIHEDIAKEKADADAIRLVNQNRGQKLEFGRTDKSGRSCTSLFGVPDWQNTKNLNSADCKVGDLSRLGQIRSSSQSSFGPGGQLSSLSLSENKKNASETQDTQKELTDLSQTSDSSIPACEQDSSNTSFITKSDYNQENNEKTQHEKSLSDNLSSSNLPCKTKLSDSMEDISEETFNHNSQENQLSPTEPPQLILQKSDSDDQNTLEKLADFKESHNAIYLISNIFIFLLIDQDFSAGLIFHMKDRVRSAPLRRVYFEKTGFERVKKNTNLSLKKRSFDVNKKWVHDLYNEKNESIALNEEIYKKLALNPLFQRLQGKRDVEKGDTVVKNPLYARLNGSQVIIKGSAQGKNSWTIKGISGATTVIISNLVQGTSAEDVKTSLSSLVQAEVTFSLRSEANTVVEKLNQAIADGNVLTVYIKEK
ncbi:hypothetical protein MERGE_002779 [Pneumocystis wakefieldiae]|uniref:MIF4G domain-containing protein n=1 Tax=Pneumocystis wakefieldiae TaxID=38082 RepID=A0A899G296_9ASCO|nr:hypothetical protein MERGE_002779 [Pneumocystis wakefieldiae]